MLNIERNNVISVYNNYAFTVLINKHVVSYCTYKHN